MSRTIPAPSISRAVAILLLAGAGLLAAPARADSDEGRDHDRARAAVASGQVLPLRKILEALERLQPPGQPAPQVLEVELEERHGRWHYEIKLLQGDGRVTKVRLDARTAEPLRGPRER